MNNRMPKILTSPTKNAREVVNPLINVVHVGFSRFGVKKGEDHFLPGCIQACENALRRLVAYTHISNMQKHQNGNLLCLIGYF